MTIHGSVPRANQPSVRVPSHRPSKEGDTSSQPALFAPGSMGLQNSPPATPPTSRPQGPTSVSIDGHRMQATEIFWTYWYLAAERQAIFHRRASGCPAPWTTDPILSTHRFTNAYRASDRVSQYLLHHVIYDAQRDAADTFFRTLLFKIFNRIDTWEYLRDQIGEPELSSFDPDRYARALDPRIEDGTRIYSAAYIMPSPQLGHQRKHANHLALLHRLVVDGSLERLRWASGLRQLYQQLLDVPSFGPFLAFQYAIDLNYSPHLAFDEMEYVVAGPGALRGIAKCFTDTGGLDAAGVIRAMTRAAPQFLETSPVPFVDLWGRPLQLIDVQNLFCEVDKYARVAHPGVMTGGPTRIKQSYRADPRPLRWGYPPHWGLPFSAATPATMSEKLTMM